MKNNSAYSIIASLRSFLWWLYVELMQRLPEIYEQADARFYVDGLDHQIVGVE